MTANPNPNAEDNLQLVTLLSKTYSVAAGITNDSEKKGHFIKSGHEAENLVQKLSKEYQSPAMYQCGLLYALGGDTAKASAILHKVTDLQFFLPELYWHIIYLEGGNDKLRWKMEDELGKMLPLSTWGKMIDDKLESNEAVRLDIPLSRREWPFIPKIENENLFKIARLFDEMGLAKDAANAYREAIYCLAPPRLPVFGEDSWISGKTAEYWLSTARNEALIGYKNWAFQAVLMAVISSPKTLQESLSIVKQLNGPPNPDLKPKPDAEKFNQIASLYKECNLHTRAIESLNLGETVLKIDLSQTKKAITGEWKKLIDEYTDGRKEICFLFGYKVSQKPPEQLLPRKFPYGK